MTMLVECNGELFKSGALWYSLSSLCSQAAQTVSSEHWLSVLVFGPQAFFQTTGKRLFTGLGAQVNADMELSEWAM